MTHLHGSASLPQYDGYANDFTVPGYVKTYKYPNTRRRAPSGTTTTGTWSRPRTCTRGWPAFYPYSDQYERAQLPRASTTYR